MNNNYIKKILKIRKNIEYFYQDRKRVENLKYFEKKYIANGYNLIAGIDEVGRGALAGPVVAAAVIIKNIDIFYLALIKDSKKLNKTKREKLSRLILEKSEYIGIGVVAPEVIDRINIAMATFLAMKRAIRGLGKLPSHILVDAFKIPYIDIPQKNIIKGEDKSISIAAASIVAKVYRDKIMYSLHNEHPVYQFDKNVGYGTRNHLTAIKKYGICPIHRKTFKNVADSFNDKTKIIQERFSYSE